jgi:hypothetical protein
MSEGMMLDAAPQAPQPLSAQEIQLYAARWLFCSRYGFPTKGQNDRPAWTAYAGDLRAGGATPADAIDSLMRTMGLIK